MDPTLAALAGVVELEKPEFNGAVGEGGVEVQHMVAAGIVVVAPAPVGVLAFIPHIGQGRHCAGLFPIQPLQEARINGSTVVLHPALVEIQGAGQQALVACHQVRQVPQGSGGMAVGSDVDMHPTAVGRIADGTGVAELAGDFLQVLQVVIGKDRGAQLGLLGIAGGADAGVPCDFPHPALPVLAAPGIVTASLMPHSALSAKVFRYHLSGLLASDPGHFDFHTDGLLLHVLDHFSKFRVHFVSLRGLIVSVYYHAIAVITRG